MYVILMQSNHQLGSNVEREREGGKNFLLNLITILLLDIHCVFVSLCLCVCISHVKLKVESL